MRSVRRFGLLARVLVLTALASVANAQSRADADAMRAKLDKVAASIDAPRPPGATLRTTFTELEINAYLALDGSTFLPAGVASPQVRIGDDGRVQARAIVDLDAVRRSRERSAFDPLAYLTGSVEVIAAGRIAASDGRGVIRYESATVGGIAVPQTVAQELLRFYTRTPERPRGFAFDEPFALPHGLRALTTERGAITITH